MKAQFEIVIWKDVPVFYKERNGKIYAGDVPIGRFNDITKCFEPCFNHRGFAYAARKRQKYRKTI